MCQNDSEREFTSRERAMIAIYEKLEKEFQSTIRKYSNAENFLDFEKDLFEMMNQLANAQKQLPQKYQESRRQA